MSKGKTTATGENTILVRAERRARRYDEERGCYVYDISFKTSALAVYASEQAPPPSVPVAKATQG